MYEQRHEVRRRLRLMDIVGAVVYAQGMKLADVLQIANSEGCSKWEKARLRDTWKELRG